MSYIDQIERLGPCSDAVKWLREANYPTPQEAWAACSRADWMLWLLGRGQSDPRALALCACDIAETVLIHTPAGEDRPRFAIETARRWARGEASVEELRSASRAVGAAAYAAYTVRAAYAAYAAIWAAAHAAYAAEHAIEHAIEHAARAAAHAADDAANVAADAATADAARAAAHDAALAAHAADATAADLVRRHFPNPPNLESA